MVNGHDVEVCDHYEAVNIMREAGSQLRLEVSREVTRIVPEKVGLHDNVIHKIVHMQMWFVLATQKTMAH